MAWYQSLVSCALFALALAMSVTAQAQPARAVHGEFPIAAAAIGWDDATRKPVRAVLTVALVGTPSPSPLERYTQGCLDVRIRDVGLHVRNRIALADETSPWRAPGTVLTDLAKRHQVEKTPVTYAALADARLVRARAIQRALLTEARSHLERAFSDCGLPHLQPGAQAVLFIRECPAAVRVCADLDRHPGASGRPMTEQMFDIVASMILANSTKASNVAIAIGHFEEISATGALSAPSVLEDVVEKEVWPAVTSAEVAVARFELLVERLRALPNDTVNRTQLAMAVPALLGLSKTQLLQVQDVTRDALSVVELLPKTSTVVFRHISDEVARSRIVECTRLRGLTEASQIASCAGYSLASESLQACLTGGECRPVLAEKAYAAVLDITQRLDVAALAAGTIQPLSELIQNAQLPRVMLPASLTQLRQQSAACAAQGHTSPEALATCLAISTLPADQQAAVRCIADSSRLGDVHAPMTHCINGHVPQATLEQIQCFTKANISVRDFAACAGLPADLLRDADQWQARVQCMGDAATATTAAECFEEELIGLLGPDAANLAGCLGEREAAERCARDYLLQQSGISPQAAALVNCLAEYDAATVQETRACVFGAIEDELAGVRIAAAAIPCLDNVVGDDARTRAAICVSGVLLNELGGRTTRELVGCAAQGVTPAAAACTSAVLAREFEDPLTRCVVQSGASPLGVTTCGLAKVLSGNRAVDRAALCVLNNGGPSAPAAACALGLDTSKRELAVAIQCASYSPDPSSFATCAAGQLVVLEASECLNSRFGEGRCFGPNNDLQKALKAVGIDLSGGTLPARFIDAQFEFYRQQLYFGKKAVKELGRFSESAGKALAEVGRDAGKVVKKADETLKKVGREIKRIGRKLGL